LIEISETFIVALSLSLSLSLSPGTVYGTKIKEEKKIKDKRKRERREFFFLIIHFTHDVISFRKPKANLNRPNNYSRLLLNFFTAWKRDPRIKPKRINLPKKKKT
jgi:hypothetical protein